MRRIGFVAATGWRLLLCPGDDIAYTTGVVFGAGATTTSQAVERQAVIPDSKVKIPNEEEILDSE